VPTLAGNPWAAASRQKLARIPALRDPSPQLTRSEVRNYKPCPVQLAAKSPPRKNVGAYTEIRAHKPVFHICADELEHRGLIALQRNRSIDRMWE